MKDEVQKSLTSSFSLQFFSTIWNLVLEIWNLKSPVGYNGTKKEEQLSMDKRGTKVALLFSLILTLVFLTGCIKTSFVLKIEKDGSGELGFRLAMNESLYSMTKEGQDPLEQWRKDLKKEGFTVKDYKEDGFVGVEASKKVKDVVKEFNKFKKAGKDNFFKDLVLEKKSNLLTTTYNLKGSVDLSDLSLLGDLGEGKDAEKLAQLALSQVKVGLVVKLPQKPKSHNATKVSKDGTELTWDFTPGKKNRVKMEVTILNTTLIYTGAALILGLVLLLIFGIRWLVKKVRKSKSA